MENFYKIDTKAHYFVPLHTVSDYDFISLINVSDEPHLIECKLEPYKFSGFKYKLYAVPVNPDLHPYFEHRCFYSSDFSSMVRLGQIVKKTSDDMRVVPMRAAEHLYGDAYLIHDFETIIGG